MKITMMSKTHVKPNKPVLGKKQFHLTTFDLPYLAFYYNQKFLLYKFQNVLDLEEPAFQNDVVEKLKDGLGLVLDDFYQLAGKLAKDDEGVFRVEYDADDGEINGVEFSVAETADVSVDDLTAEDGTAKFKELVPYNGILNLEGLGKPLLAVQVTKLKDGLAMGLAFNHAVLDGTSTWHFMSTWAEICRGSQSISTQPFLDRSKARATRVKLDLASPKDPNASSNGENAGELTASPPQLVEKIFTFSDSAIHTIKSRANSVIPSDGSKPFSTFQSLSSHIWRHVTLARGLKPEDITVFTVFADCRRRVDPPMPEEYFGNLIQAIFTGTAAGLLAAHGPEFGASVIQKAIVAHDASAIDARNDEWEKSPKIFQFKDAGVNCVAVGSSPRFKVYEVDFGWGKPETVRSGSNNRFDGMMYLYQGKAGGISIDVEITLEASVMEKLEKNNEFLLIGEEENGNKISNGNGNGNGNDGTIGDFIGRFCNPQEISPLTLQSYSLNSQISQNFPIPGGIRFPPYPGQFGSDREFGVLGSQPTTQESNKSSLLDPDSDRPHTTKSNSRKRKSIPSGNGKESPASSSLTASNSKISEENGGSKAAKRSKQDEAGSSKNGMEKSDSKGDAKFPEPPKDYIHVRARRGQATDSHSLAERARREKISERMTLLQDLVPGCNRITGKAVMLDEIINYVQSLQRQVEFLSMKLATINPRMEFNANAGSTEMIQPGESLTQSLYAIACSEQRLPSGGYYSLGKSMPRFSDTQFDGFVQSETPPGFWENDLQSIVQMGFGDIQQQSNNNNNCSEPTLQMKLEP